MNKDTDENGLDWQKRRELAKRVTQRGRNPNFVYELTLDGLAELERRLDEIESAEESDEHLSRWNFISSLLRQEGRQKSRHYPLRYDDLPRDSLLVTKQKGVELMKRCDELGFAIEKIDSQIRMAMGDEKGDDRIENLRRDRDAKVRRLKELQDEMDQFF